MLPAYIISLRRHSDMVFNLNKACRGIRLYTIPTKSSQGAIIQ